MLKEIKKPCLAIANEHQRNIYTGNNCYDMINLEISGDWRFFGSQPKNCYYYYDDLLKMNGKSEFTTNVVSERLYIDGYFKGMFYGLSFCMFLSKSNKPIITSVGSLGNSIGVNISACLSKLIDMFEKTSPKKILEIYVRDVDLFCYLRENFYALHLNGIWDTEVNNMPFTKELKGVLEILMRKKIKIYLINNFDDGKCFFVNRALSYNTYAKYYNYNEGTNFQILDDNVIQNSFSERIYGDKYYPDEIISVESFTCNFEDFSEQILDETILYNEEELSSSLDIVLEKVKEIEIDYELDDINC